MDQQENDTPDSDRNSWIDSSSASDDRRLTTDSVESSPETDMPADHEMSCGDSERATPGLYSQDGLADSDFEVGPKQSDLHGLHEVEC